MEREWLKQTAREIGFDAAGVAPAVLLSDEAQRVAEWAAEGKNAGMAYMERNREVREDVARLVEGAKSVIVTLTNYYHPRLQPAGVPAVALYARGKDYHIVVKNRLHVLLHEILTRHPGHRGRCFVDSAPVLEHAWARRAGLGWQGKNTLLIRKGLGSFCFIGVIVTTVESDTYDTPFTRSYCGRCTRCVDACPTGALSAGQVDARRCLSYHTIENRGDYPPELRRLAGGRIFGCDACQTVCPWNLHLAPHSEPAFLPVEKSMELTADEWLSMDTSAFDALFRDSPLQRAGLERLKRNLKNE